MKKILFAAAIAALMAAAPMAMPADMAADMPFGTVAQAAVNDTFDDGKLKYTVTSEGDSNTVAVAGLTDTNTDTAITIPSAVTNGDITYTVTSIGYQAFYGCSTLTSITIPDGVTSIGESAFDWCIALESVTIPDSVTEIESYAFFLCSNLAEIKGSDGEVIDGEGETTVGKGVTTIGDGAFMYVPLTSLTIGKAVTFIDIDAFSGCPLTEVNAAADNANYSSVDGILFNKDKTTLELYPDNKTDTSYTIPDGVTTIAYGAFESCKVLTSITIPDSVTSIEDFAFGSCSSLESITIPDGVTTLSYCLFESCSSLESITIPDSVTSIGDSVFLYCTALKSVTIPDSVTSIGNKVFEGCGALASVEIPASVTTIGDGAFPESCAVTCYADESEITLGTGVTVTYKPQVVSKNIAYCYGNAAGTIPTNVTIKDAETDEAADLNIADNAYILTITLDITNRQEIAKYTLDIKKDGETIETAASEKLAVIADIGMIQVVLGSDAVVSEAVFAMYDASGNALGSVTLEQSDDLPTSTL